MMNLTGLVETHVSYTRLRSRLLHRRTHQTLQGRLASLQAADVRKCLRQAGEDRLHTPAHAQSTPGVTMAVNRR